MGNQHNNLNRRGIAVVEMAIVLILLMLVVFGILEYGWAFTRSGQVVNAARGAARLAVLPDADWAVIETQTLDKLENSGFKRTSITVVASPADITNLNRGDDLTVSVDIDPYQSLTGLDRIMPLPKKLHAEVTMAKEGVAGPS